VLVDGVAMMSCTLLAADAVGVQAAKTPKPLTASALTPEYRREMIRVFTKRAVLAAAQGAGQN